MKPFQHENPSRFAAYLDALLSRENVKEAFPTVCTSLVDTSSSFIGMAGRVVTYHRNRFGEAR